MKKLFLVLTLSLLSSLALTATNTVTIKGKWERGGEDVSLYKVVSGRLEPVSTYNLDKDNDFGFVFTPKYEGFYAIGTGFSQAKTDKFMFYFKPGDKLNIEVSDSIYQLVGENSSENLVMEKWYNWIYPIHDMAVYFFTKTDTYVDFFPILEEAVANPFEIPSTGNALFNEQFKRFTEVELISNAMNFLHTPRSAHPHVDEYPDFYRDIDFTNLTRDDFLMKYPFGSGLITTLLFLSERLEGLETQREFDDALSMIPDNSLKGEYLLSKARGIKTYLGYKQLIDPYQEYLVTEDQQDRASAIAEELAKSETESGKTVDFAHQDVDGNYVSLSDFKGKVVLVDVWATWCGPCLSQIPHLKALEKKYEGEDIVFMCVSVDELENYDKWKEFIKKEDMAGIQLFAGGFQSDIAKFYNITGIPRFMLFDKEGNIVSNNAPRPSDEELSILIDNELKK